MNKFETLRQIPTVATGRISAARLRKQTLMAIEFAVAAQRKDTG